MKQIQKNKLTPKISIEKLSEKNLNESISAVQNAFPCEVDKKLIDEYFRSSLSGKPIEGAKEVKYYTVKVGSEIIGAVGVYSTPEDYKEARWIGWYGIKPEYRKKGIGTKVLQFAIDEAKKEGAKYMRVWSSTHPNEHTSHRLYERQGFKKIKEEPFDKLYNKLTYELKLHKKIKK